MSADKGVSAFPENDNLFKWIGTIEGPQNTVNYFFRFVYEIVLLLCELKFMHEANLCGDFFL